MRRVFVHTRICCLSKGIGEKVPKSLGLALRGFRPKLSAALLFLFSNTSGEK